MYHNSMCCSSVRPLRFQGNRRICPTQRNKFDPLSLYGGLRGLSFDPTNTHALLCAMNALQSIKDPRRCSIQTSCPDSPLQSSPCSSSKSSSNSSRNSSGNSSGNSSDSLTAPSTPAPIPCPYGPAQSIPVSEAVQTCSSNSNTSSSQENSSRRMSQRGSSTGCEQVQAGGGTSSKDSEKNGLTWIDWGWPGTHTPCPFNQRHTVDDILIRPERIFCKRSNGLLCTFCPCIGKLVRCCKLRIRQLRAACSQEEITTTAVDVKELFASYIFVADIPGLKHTDIKVQVENDEVLKISGEWKREDVVQDFEVKYVRVERRAGKFMRRFNLPANANLDNISAACQDGLLTIIVPKTPPPDMYRPRTLDVNVTSANLGL